MIETKDFQYEFYSVTEVEEGFVHVQYTNAKTLNAFSEPNWRAYGEILHRLDNEPSVNVILISSGVAKAFSSGLNLKTSTDIVKTSNNWSPEAKQRHMYQHIKDFQDAIAMPARMNTPTICLMNGICYGLAMDIASACTIRVCTEDVKMSIREIQIGIVADMGSLQRLPPLVSNQLVLSQYALTGEVFGHKEAEKLGLVSKVVPDVQSGIEYCTELGQTINSAPQWAIKGTKKSLQDMYDGGSHEQGLEWVARYNAQHILGLPKL